MTTASSRKLKVLMAHNYYQQPGGEDGVFAAEIAMLKEKGHSVIEYTEHNDRIREMSPLAVFRDTLWSSYTYKRFVKLIKKEKPDIAHFHNIFPLISPSAYYACKKMGVPVVQTLHNYRLLCPGAIFYRDKKICEKCIGNPFPIYQTSQDYKDSHFFQASRITGHRLNIFPWPAVRYGCYHKSVLHSFAVSLMLFLHRVFGTWRSKVDAFIALTEFGRMKFIEGGLSEDKIFVKPNFISSDPGKREKAGDYALFVGRLTREKGLYTLLEAWETIKDASLKIVGDGPLMDELKDYTVKRNMKNVEFLGSIEKEEVFSFMKNADFLVFPSEWYETFGLVGIEAFSCGVPVVASSIGAMKDIIKDLHSGLTFEAGNASSLKNKIKYLLENKEKIEVLGKNGRMEFENKYTFQMNYNILINIYEKFIQE